MFKNITRQLQALLSRHLPHRLVQRDPLPISILAIIPQTDIGGAL
jgi:hypothetical protein